MKNRMLAAAAVLIACLLLGMVPGYAAGEETDVHSSAVRDVSGDLLLLVDFQNVYLPGNDWACPSMPDAIRNTIKILAAENTPDYLMTRYIAPADPFGRWEQYNEAYREINDNDFLAEIVEELAPYAADAAVVDKSTYSSMDAPEVLAAMEGKRAVVLTGVVADCCILATMFDAIDLGYEVVYLYDCIAGASAESEAEIRALAEIFQPIHTTVMSSEEYLAAIGADEMEANRRESEVESNGEVYVLFTSDVHCGIDQGFGYAGLKQIRDTLEAQGYATLLVDDGDSIQGEPIGTLSKGEAIVSLMNEIGYDVAIPGNHEFDYGTDRFLELVDMAEYPYICCNFTYMGEPVLAPYIIEEVAGLKIAFVGVTTPKTITSSTPAYFQDENGEYVYGFMQDDTGEAVYAAVQSAVDDARSDGADLVYVMGHMGLEADCAPWTYADVIEHTNGIDVFLDGHSHDTEQVVMQNMDGEDVVRCAVGTKLSCIGYSHISAEGEVLETGIWSWPNSVSAPVLLGIDNEIGNDVNAAQAELSEQLDTVVASTLVDLTINDPVEVDEQGNPIRMIRRAETNLGDLCADAYRDQSGADIAFVNGGGIRVSIDKGDITYGDIISVHPFGNMLCVVEATGQQILDALEWGSRAVPGETGGFQQVSGLSYEIHVDVESSCTEDENGMFTGVDGEYRVQNVMVGDEPLDPERTYTLASHNYMLLENGDGYTMFDGAPLLQDSVKLDNQVLIDYIVDTLGGVIGEEYADPYGQGRIVITE